MEFLQPATWVEALQMKAAHPQAVPIQGGTDVMVELNFDRYRPEYLLDLTRVERADAVGAGRRAHPAGRGRQLHARHHRARRPAARPGDGLAHRRVAPDPQPRHRRRQPRRRLAGRRRPSRAAGRVRARRGRVGARCAADPGRGVLHRREAQRAEPRRADQGGADRPAVRPAAVLQDRHPQRHGHLGVGVRPGPAPRPGGGRHRHRVGGPDAAPGTRRRSSSSRSR